MLHVVPVDDLREHELTIDCWCNPEEDDEEPTVIIHNAMDERETYENGRRKFH